VSNINVAISSSVSCTGKKRKSYYYKQNTKTTYKLVFYFELLIVPPIYKYIVAHTFAPSFWWGSCCSVFSFMCMFCRSLFVLLYFFFWPLCCLFFNIWIDYPFGIFKLFFIQIPATLKHYKHNVKVSTIIFEDLYLLKKIPN